MGPEPPWSPQFYVIKPIQPSGDPLNYPPRAL